MIKEANQRKLNELMADFEKDAKRWADEKSDLVKEFEKFKSESAFKEEEWKKKYEVIISQEVERRQETWQRGCDQLRIEIETLKAIIEKKDREYEAKNKEWCNIPDEVLKNFQAAASKTKGFSGQACTAAAKMKQMMEQQREQAANGGGLGAPPKLPAGPL